MLALQGLIVGGIGWKLVLSLDSGIKARQTPGLFVSQQVGGEGNTSLTSAHNSHTERE